MPLYEYTCPHCQHDFEELVFGDQTPNCPACGKPKPVRRLSVPAAPPRSASLPVCSSRPAGGCGLPQCGQGFCSME